MFVRCGERIHRFWSSELRLVPAKPGQHHCDVDFMWPLWSILDRTPAGRGADWHPRLKYG